MKDILYWLAEHWDKPTFSVRWFVAFILATAFIQFLRGFVGAWLKDKK